MKERLQKILSARGVASRRKAEELIRAGQVSVNGVPASLGDSADPETDDIRVAGQPLAAREKNVCILLNKPRGSPPCPTKRGGRTWPALWRTAAHGCTPSGGWTWTPRDFCF